MNESYSPPTRSCTANSSHCLVALQEIIISILKNGDYTAEKGIKQVLALWQSVVPIHRWSDT